MTQTAVIPGSLAFVATQAHQSIAESFVNADAVIIVDTSGSMMTNDSRDGQSRYDVACQELARLQHDMPGKLAVISFSDSAEFCPSGVPRFMGGGTNLAGALAFAGFADLPGMRFFVISDGYPDNEEKALKMAKTYKATISTVFVGPESDTQGRAFLAQLAAAAGGADLTAECVLELADKLTPLLKAGN
jgi:hypothetical protein